MWKVSLSDGLAIAGFILAIILAVLDKGGRLKGPFLLILLGVAACMAIPLLFSISWVADAPAGLPMLTRRMLMLFLIGVSWAGISVWITTGDVDEAAVQGPTRADAGHRTTGPTTPPKLNPANVFDPSLAEWRIEYAPYDLTLHDLYLTDFKSVQQRASGAVFVDTAQKISFSTPSQLSWHCVVNS